MTRDDDQRERGEWHPPDDNVVELPPVQEVKELFPGMKSIVIGAATGDVWPTDPFDSEEERTGEHAAICPKCQRRLSNLMVNDFGFCEVHGNQPCDWGQPQHDEEETT